MAEVVFNDTGKMPMQNIQIKGLRNTRDLGGLPTERGVIVRAGLLLRGGHLHDVDARNAAKLQSAYQVRHIIDLRTDIERDEKPDAPIPGARYYHLPILEAATVGITHEQASDDRASLLARLPDIRELYASMVVGDAAERLSSVVRLIVEAGARNEPVLFHCTEGKDRTGLVSLVLLSMLDVPMEAILEDYLFTNGYARSRARKYYWIVLLLKRDRALARKIRGLFLADKTYLDAALEAIERNYGSMRAFVTDGLHITEQEQRAFSENMT